MARELMIRSQRNSELSFDSQSIKEAAKILRVFDHPISLKLLQTIEAHQPVSLIALCKMLSGEKVLLARYLNQLVQAQYITERRKGRSRHYSVNNERIQQVQCAVRTFSDPA